MDEDEDEAEKTEEEDGGMEDDGPPSPTRSRLRYGSPLKETVNVQSGRVVRGLPSSGGGSRTPRRMGLQKTQSLPQEVFGDMEF